MVLFFSFVLNDFISTYVAGFIRPSIYSELGLSYFVSPKFKAFSSFVSKHNDLPLLTGVLNLETGFASPKMTVIFFFVSRTLWQHPFTSHHRYDIHPVC